MLQLSNLYPYLMLMGSVADVFLLGKGFFLYKTHSLTATFLLLPIGDAWTFGHLVPSPLAECQVLGIEDLKCHLLHMP